MAKKTSKVISEVTFKNPKQEIDLPRIGMHLTADNLTIARYYFLVTRIPSCEKNFNVKFKLPENESQMESKK